jgi:hypothetical protein
MAGSRRRLSPCDEGSSEQGQASVVGGDYGSTSVIGRSQNSVVGSANSSMCPFSPRRMMEACSDGPAIYLTNDDRREENDMYPGPSDTDWQVAKFQHRELLAMAQHQQFVASILAATTDARPMSTPIRRQLDTLLVRAGQRLQGAQAVARESGVSTTPVELELGATA